MSPETQDERNSRIRDEQMRDRSHSTAKKPHHSGSAKKPSVPRQVGRSSQPHAMKQETPAFDLFQLPLGGTRDIVIGLAYGLLPTLLAAILLPGTLKLLALLVLAITGAVGYLLGTAAS